MLVRIAVERSKDLQLYSHTLTGLKSSCLCVHDRRRLMRPDAADAQFVMVLLCIDPSVPTIRAAAVCTVYIHRKRTISPGYHTPPRTKLPRRFCSNQRWIHARRKWTRPSPFSPSLPLSRKSARKFDGSRQCAVLGGRRGLALR